MPSLAALQIEAGELKSIGLSKISKGLEVHEGKEESGGYPDPSSSFANKNEAN